MGRNIMLKLLKRIRSLFICDHIWDKTTYCLSHEEASVHAFVCIKCGKLVKKYTEDGCSYNINFNAVSREYERQFMEGMIR